jgi:26S proteasome regulatory subunit N2
MHSLCCVLLNIVAQEAIDLLEPLARDDSVDFVRQGALIALAMVLIQTNKAQEPRVRYSDLLLRTLFPRILLIVAHLLTQVETVRKMFEEKIADKHEETMCKFGAILASGIIDAGGPPLAFIDFYIYIYI